MGKETDQLRAIQDELLRLRAEYEASHEEAKAALEAKDYELLRVISAREFKIVNDYCGWVDLMLRTVVARNRSRPL